MNLSNLTWLHLSDAHIPSSSTDTYKIDKVLAALTEILKEEGNQGLLPDLIFFTGDIADKGKDYSKVEQFFNDLLEVTGLSQLGTLESRRRLFIVPGNHDVDRGKLNPGLKRTFEKIDEAVTFFDPYRGDYRVPHFARFEEYANFFNRYFDGLRQFTAAQHYYAEILDLSDIPIRLGIIGLNSAWFSQDPEDEKKLWIGERVCDAALEEIERMGGADLIITLHHHPYSWLHPEDRRHVKALLTRKADICLFGHLHEPETEDVHDQYGRVLRLQSGATYDESPWPYKFLWGHVALPTCKVRIRPMTYQPVPRQWTIDTSIYPHNAPHYTEEFDLPRLQQRQLHTLRDYDAPAFYSGGQATYAEIAANLDVQRKQYIEDWIDQEQVTQTSWRALLFKQAENVSKNKPLRIVIVYGHRGSGKTTLSTRMMKDLEDAGFPVIDLLDDTLAPEHLPNILGRAKMANGKCLHIFTEIDDVKDIAIIRHFKHAVKSLAQAGIPLNIYLTIDTNKWRTIEAKVGEIAHIAGCRLESRHLSGSFDERELDDLISRLKLHNCLFRLVHKTDATIWALFRRKARRGLLVALIEVTRGTEEGQDLEEIVWQEYQGLSERAKRTYEVVTLFHAFAISVPYSVLQTALEKLTGDAGYFESEAFHSETAEIVIYKPRSASYRSRHQLIAETLWKQHFAGSEWDSFKVRLVLATLNSLDLSLPLHRAFFDLLLERKVFQHITDLSLLIREVREGKINSIQEKNISRVLNSIIRIYQGRRKYLEGTYLADESLRLWNHVGNQAFYLKAFCLYHLGKTSEARSAALELIQAIDYPYHVLHGIELLNRVRDWDNADQALKNFEQRERSDLDLYPDYHDLRKDVDKWLMLKNLRSDADIDTLRPSVALEKLELMVASYADEKIVVDAYRRLLDRQHAFFKGYVSLFKYLNRYIPEEEDEGSIHRYLEIQEICEFHLAQAKGFFRSYPADVLSILHSDVARASFKIDYISKNGYVSQSACNEHFTEAIRLEPNNLYAHNWYGTFLKEVKKDYVLAKTCYERAIHGDRNNPVFKNNLALLYANSSTFSRAELELARGLANESRLLCEVGSHWETFRDYPQELIEKLNALLSRTDLSEGDPLDLDMLLPLDVK